LSERKGRWEIEIRWMELMPDESFREDESARKVVPVTEEELAEIRRLLKIEEAE